MLTFHELKRRKIVQWALAYLAGAWIAVQLVRELVDAWGFPDPVVQTIHILLVLGFFVTLVLAWYHGEKGQQRVSGPELLMVTALLVIAGAAIAVATDDPPAEVREGPGEAAALSAPGGGSIPHTSIAVLPLDDNSPDPADAYFADAMTQEITSALAKVPGFRVSAPSSAAKFAQRNVTAGESAREVLGVAHILEGSAQLVDGRARITVQLIDAASEQHVWSDTYEAEFGDVLEVQVEIARDITDALATEFSERAAERILAGSTDDPEAYDLYLQARVAGSPDQRLRLLGEAVTKDSSFSVAWGALADAYYDERSRTRDTLLTDSIAFALDRAIDTAEDPSSAAMGRVFRILFFQEDLTDATAALRQITRESPSNLTATSLLGNMHLLNGDLAESIEWYRRAIVLDPLDPQHRRAVGLVYMTLGLDPLAESAHEKARELGADVWSRTFQMGLLQGDYEEAIEAVDSLRAAGHPYADIYAAGVHVWSGDPEAAQRILADVDDALLATFQWEEAPMVAHVSLLAGDTARAERLLRQAETVPAAPRDLVRGAELDLKVASVRGDTERAAELLRRMTELGSRRARWFRANPMFSRVRDDPEFEAALAEQEGLIARERREVERMLAEGGWAE